MFILQDVTEYASSEEIRRIYFADQGSWTNSRGNEDEYEDTNISARINKYSLNTFTLDTVSFLDKGNVNGRDVNIGTLKFSITLDDYDFSSDSGDSLMICFNITVNEEIEELDDDYEDAYEFTLGSVSNRFRLINERTATCTDLNNDATTIGVIAKRNGNLLCYTFERCNGKLFYDPFVYYEGDDADSKGIRHDQFGFAMIGFIIIMIYNSLL